MRQVVIVLVMMAASQVNFEVARDDRSKTTTRDPAVFVPANTTHDGALSSQTSMQQKVFSVGDLHGDYDRFKMILEGLNLATFEGGIPHWIGGNSVLVSTGDTVDRGEHSRPIYIAFQELARQAPLFGGEVVNILGNHELMNLQGDLRYVHPNEFRRRGDYGGKRGRIQDWSPTGIIGKDLRKRYVAVAVRKGTLFLHAGLHAAWLDTSSSNPLEDLNTKVQQLLSPDVAKDHELLNSDHGPFWDRFFAGGNEEAVCREVQKTLNVLGATRMVVGHTPQLGGVNVRCDGPSGPRIILGDTLISRAYGEDGVPSAIEYDGSAVTAIYFSRGTTHRRILG
jgi:hypothetical protein